MLKANAYSLVIVDEERWKLLWEYFAIIIASTLEDFTLSRYYGRFIPTDIDDRL